MIKHLKNLFRGTVCYSMIYCRHQIKKNQAKTIYRRTDNTADTAVIGCINDKTTVPRTANSAPMPCETALAISSPKDCLFKLLI